MNAATERPSSDRLATASFEGLHRDGTVCARRLLSPEMTALPREGMGANRPGDFDFVIEPSCSRRDNAACRRVVFDSALPGSSQVRLHDDHMLTEEPDTRAPTLWHRGQPCDNSERNRSLSMCIASDRVRQHSTLEFVGGSHSRSLSTPRSWMDSQARRFPEGSLAERPDIDAQLDLHRILGREIEPGDVGCFQMLALHAPGGADGHRRHRELSVLVLEDDIRHAPSACVASPAFPGLAERLPVGAAMADPLLPLPRETA